MIEVKNLVKKYGDYVAVDHLSFQIEKGQVYGFLGPNGAGKSKIESKYHKGIGEIYNKFTFKNGEE